MQLCWNTNSKYPIAAVLLLYFKPAVCKSVSWAIVFGRRPLIKPLSHTNIDQVNTNFHPHSVLHGKVRLRFPTWLYLMTWSRSGKNVRLDMTYKLGGGKSILLWKAQDEILARSLVSSLAPVELHHIPVESSLSASQHLFCSSECCFAKHFYDTEKLACIGWDRWFGSLFDFWFFSQCDWGNLMNIREQSATW